MGAAGRAFNKKTHCKIARITGLDPAFPCFYHIEVPTDPYDENDINRIQKLVSKISGNFSSSLDGILKSLSASDAKFVDIIHTDTAVLGVEKRIGHIDFYPDGGHTQRLCDGDHRCSHKKAVEYFANSIAPGSENRYQAQVNCFDLVEWREFTNCYDARDELFAMGYAANKGYPRASFYKLWI